MISSFRRLALLGLAAGALAACTTSGTGVGSSQGGALQSTFTWTSDDGVRGQMTAALSDGRRFDGPFFQVTQETQASSLSPLWYGWEGRGRWHGWTGWGAGDFTAVTYSGMVLANLQDASGARMRCRFHLVRPRSGLADGGSGRCQLPDGTIILADFAGH